MKGLEIELSFVYNFELVFNFVGLLWLELQLKIVKK